MARKKWVNPNVTAVIRKPKPGRVGEPKQRVDHHFDNLFMREASRTKRRNMRRSAFRGAFRSSARRSSVMADKFFRLFSMFLVCLVLFTVVSGAGYESYQSAVHVLYETTEVVGAAGSIVARGLIEVTGVVDGLFEKPALTGSGILKLKIKGEWLSFAVEETSWAYGLSYHSYKVIETPVGYEDWKDEIIVKIFSWYFCPDLATRKGEFTDYSEGEQK